MPGIKKFVILAQPRTGSTFVADLFASHPKAFCYQELFSHVRGHPERFNTFLENLQAAGEKRLEERIPELLDGYLKAVLALRGFTAVGFKLIQNQVKRYPSLPGWFAANGVHIIHLVRENHLEALVSMVRAKQTNVWHSYSDVSQVSVRLPAGPPLLAELERMAANELEISRIAQGCPRTTLYYEDVLSNARDAMLPALLALGLEPLALSAPTRKLNTLPLREAVANYGEVAETLKGSPYESFLEGTAARAGREKPGPLVFLHIPTAGGSTFEQILQNNYGPESVFMAYGHRDGEIWDYLLLDYREKRRHAAVSGHFTALYAPLLPRDSRYVCILRNPLDRVVSNYYMYLSHKNHPAGAQIRDNGITLGQFANPRYRFNQDNVQVKYVAGARLDQPCTEAMYDEALGRLRDGRVLFGIMERYKETVFRFAKLFGWIDLHYTHIAKNITKPPRKEIDKNEMRVVASFNTYDMRIYAEALGMFQTMADSLHREHGEELERYLETAMPVSIAKLHHPWRDAPGEKAPAAAAQPASRVR